MRCGTQVRSNASETKRWLAKERKEDKVAFSTVELFSHWGVVCTRVLGRCRCENNGSVNRWQDDHRTWRKAVQSDFG